MFTVQVRKEISPSLEVGSGIVLFQIRDFPDKYAGTRLCDTNNFSQAGRNRFSRNYEQDAVAYDDRSTGVGKRELVGEALFGAEAKTLEQRDFFVGSQQTGRSSYAKAFRNSQHGAVAATNVYQVVAGVETDCLGDLLMNQLCDCFFSPSPES